MHTKSFKLKLRMQKSDNDMRLDDMQISFGVTVINVLMSKTRTTVTYLLCHKVKITI